MIDQIRRIPLVGRILSRYAEEMPIGRPSEVAIQTVKHAAELDPFEGKWVAVKGRRVIEHADTSSQLALKVRQLGDAGRGAVMQFVQPEAETFVVGVG